MSIDTEAFQRALNIAKPALSAQSFVPILTHFLLDEDWVLAWNDIFGIGVRAPHDLSCAVPGTLTHSVLSSITASKVSIDEVEGKSELSITGGATKVRLPYLPADQFPQEWLPGEDDEPVTSFKATGDFLFGLAKVLVGVGIDPTHPAQMGVTLYCEHPGRYACLYSTDNFTVSEYICDDLDVELENAIVMPTAFCVHLLELDKVFDSSTIEVAIYEGLIVGRVIDDGKLIAQVSSRIVLDLTPVDFPNVMKQYLGDEDRPRYQEVGPMLPGALKRSLLMLGDSADKVCRMATSDTTLSMTTITPLGKAVDKIEFDLPLEDLEFSIDPELVERALGVATRVSPLEEVFVMSDGQSFTHLIALVTDD